MNALCRRLSVAYVFAVALAVSVSAADEPGVYTRAYGVADITVSGAASRDNVVQVALSGTITVRLRIKGGSALEVEPVQAVAVSEAWKERRRGKVEWSAPEGGIERIWRQEFDL